MTDARATRINAICDELADLVKDAIDRACELVDLEVPPADLAQLFTARKLDLSAAADSKVMQFAYMMVGQKPPVISGADAMRAQLDALFAEAPAPIEGSAAAIPDVAIVLRGFPSPISGVLTKCPTGVLKLGAVSPHSAPGQPAALIEHFFTTEDITAIVVRREVKATPVSSLFTAH